ncbi:hypothetical protein [Halosolutus halophilus]|nr:hypothetical protein [Halosolutus halophilus]
MSDRPPKLQIDVGKHGETTADVIILLQFLVAAVATMAIGFVLLSIGRV